MPNYQGVWNISTQYQNAGDWPIPPLGGDAAYFQRTQATTDAMQYVFISTTGNTSVYGNLTYNSYASAGCGSSTRGIIRHGNTENSSYKYIEYFTLSILGSNGANFGDATVAVRDMGALSNSTRAVFGGGAENTTNVMDYITIATTGNATDYGDLWGAVDGVSGTASSTRGLFAGGRIVNTKQNVINYITIASTGNSTDFGDLTVSRYGVGALCNGTRAVFGGGAIDSGLTANNTIDYVTIASTGNASNFGDLTVARYTASGTCNATRGLFAGGWGSNVIDYITIASVGNATDFGDLTSNVFSNAATSGSHGGLS